MSPAKSSLIFYAALIGIVAAFYFAGEDGKVGLIMLLGSTGLVIGVRCAFIESEREDLKADLKSALSFGRWR